MMLHRSLHLIVVWSQNIIYFFCQPIELLYIYFPFCTVSSLRVFPKKRNLKTIKKSVDIEYLITYKIMI